MFEKKITDYIPHREPFLFVDAINDLQEKSIETTFVVKENSDFFKGHYPNNPITPGVIICESVFQSAAILISSIINFQSEKLTGTPVLTRITSAKFKGMVKPGEKLIIQTNIEDRLQNTWYLKGKVLKNDKSVLNIEFAVSLIEENK
jgi:3-hydroxyacyl-[acyl-carrier-protein] dehydratase